MCGNGNITNSLLCPRCNQQMELKGSEYRCNNLSCNFFVPRIIRRKVITKKQLSDLFAHNKTGFIDGFYKKGLNETFSAFLTLNKDWKISIHLDVETNYQCPLCGSNLFQFKNGFECKNDNCKLSKIWNKFRNKDIPHNQIKKLIKTKKTDLIKGFISNKTGKYYNGYLIITDSGLLDIEFEQTERTDSYY